MANGLRGVVLENGTANTVGPNNLISGNSIDGIFVNGQGASGNAIVGNTIGLSSDGNTAIIAPRTPSNDFQYGILVERASNTTIGGTTSAARNVISGNGDGGIRLDGDKGLKDYEPEASTGNLVLGNYIGTNVAGDAPALRATYNDPGNSGDGVIVVDSPFATIGGSTPGAGNLISGNSVVGLYVIGALSTGITIEGNTIGLSADGLKLVPNQDGLVIRNAPTNLVRSNTISGNVRTGITLVSISNTAGVPGAELDLPGTDGVSDGVQILNNLIGPGTDGKILGSDTDIRGNGQGIVLNGVQGTRIIGNTISGNTQVGVHFFNNLTVRNINPVTKLPVSPYANRATTANLLQQNTIGLGPDGTSIVPNGQGVFLNDASGNTVGGSVPGQGNLIGGNISVGIQIMGDNIGLKAKPGQPTPLPTNDILNNTIGFGKGPGGFTPAPNDFGVFVNGARNPISPSNVIGDNRRGPLINRLPSYGPNVDEVATPVADPNPTDTTPLTTVVVSFTQYVDPDSASKASNYRIQKIGVGGAGGQPIAIDGFIDFNVIDRRATIKLAVPGSLTWGDTFRLTVVGMPFNGIKSRGTPHYFLDGKYNSQAGTNFVTSVHRGEQIAPIVTTPKPKPKPVKVTGRTALSVDQGTPAQSPASIVDRAIDHENLVDKKAGRTKGR